MIDAVRCPYFQKAFGYSAPIGFLAGLIGLGGGEFRLPVLMHVIGFGARSAIPLNLAISFVALVFALAVRGTTVPMAGILEFAPAVAGLMCGGIVSAIYGARLVHRLSDAHIITLMALLLAALGALLVVESFFAVEQRTWLPKEWPLHLGVGIVIGLGVGAVSSLLGVAGGELLIPALMLVFGADVKTAGSASAVISLVIIAAGLWRHYAMGAVAFGRGAQRIVTSMSLGSIIGAVAGGLAVAYAPADWLKLVLGGVLIAAAAKTALERRRQ